MRMILCGLALLGAAFLSNAPAVAQTAPERQRLGGLTVETVARGLDHPWSVAFLPDGRMLVTERAGRLRVVGNGNATPIAGVPDVRARGQGGLLDVALDPDFATNRLIYLTYAEPREGGLGGTAVARGKLDEGATRLSDVAVIFRQEPAYSGNNHFGSRLAFASDGTLFVTLGERFDLRDKAQDLDNHLGKVVRINRDGSVPRDNPFVGRSGAKPEIWTYGHRNPQSAAINPRTNTLWTIEHGARGGDEINISKKGANYGWPVIGYGTHYSGAKIGVGTAQKGMEQPIFYWDPSIAPSGMVFYTGDRYPGWQNSLFTGALAGQMLVRLQLQGDRVIREERLLPDLGARIRDVRQGPDGLIYLLTDENDGRLLRIIPAGS
ncbi:MULTISPECIES: PQQ-dependent sugar dehydrogenase [unclassified Chelatococcus]|uniref:PQQ-dependent sugar dehydrogenase n=1 Tax=unclassified Chelatococcus TaxID=2638111 RepID=UPI001BCABBB0|nr:MULTISPECIES: PQQ-dependent sugar dehydrogenase [unclassified Chelatococcus]CAH1665257.1 aldose sugar dehydrogenase YliI [Hyphomicrobiales bacterium]MBS7737694.1 PQQ-dependent sugar dehydrogenase [Chelatococcus sp. HY11]MBX3544172.1 PQQ-dependent sugar dehydrogenase [Chelatococcus sp.]MCO5079506.1 PQQ-dependent sugar dehydrogenase [Chelatococcus sp.]CAH1681439.1 aldose sugar dehydrogenase YliI [Hyphomicrobiales bacterium]